MIIKDWFYENWGKTRRRFAWTPVQISQMWVWWEYYDETLTGNTGGLYAQNTWQLNYPSTCGSDVFIKL